MMELFGGLKSVGSLTIRISLL